MTLAAGVSGGQQVAGEGILDDANPDGMVNVNGNDLSFFFVLFHRS